MTPQTPQPRESGHTPLVINGKTYPLWQQHAMSANAFHHHE